MDIENNRGFTEKQKWIFVIVSNLIILGIGYKLIFTTNISDFTFSELLALLLALFSIGISVAFYFKATDSSNRFYDNSYKFTKDIAELLVRIESTFGEKLQHLDEGYTNIRDKVDHFPYSLPSKDKAQEELDESKKELEKKLIEKEKLLNETLQNAHIDQTDRKEIITKLNQKEVELQNEKEKVELLEDRLRNIENLKEINQRKFFVPPSMKEVLRFSIIYPLTEKFIAKSSLDEIKLKFRTIQKDFSPRAFSSLVNYGIIDKNYDLTVEGIMYLKSIVLE